MRVKVSLRIMATAEKSRKARGGFLVSAIAVSRAKKKSWRVLEWKDVYLM